MSDIPEPVEWQHYNAFELTLPYIIEPAGEWQISSAGTDWIVRIQQVVFPPLVEVVTGIRFNPQSPTRVDGPKAIHIGISRVTLVEKTEPEAPWEGSGPPQGPDAFGFQKHSVLAEVLNDLQYRFLVASGRYWWQEVSADHFVNVRMQSPARQGLMSNWGGSNRKGLTHMPKPDAYYALAEHLEANEKVRVHEYFLTDAKRHYLGGQYHLMYVELATGLEALVLRAFPLLSSAYEKKLFKDGRLAGKLSFFLHQHCRFSDESIELVSAAIEARNQVIHDQKRRFKWQQAHTHLEAGLGAADAIALWITERLTPSPK